MNVDEPPGPELGRLFAIAGAQVEVVALDGGHIHHSWAATYRLPGGVEHRYVHQRLNDQVFPDVAAMAANVARVAAHLARTPGLTGAGTRRRAARRPLEVVMAGHGGPVATDERGAMWRTTRLVEGTSSPYRFSGPEQAGQAAHMAAALVGDLADLPPPPLAEVIPGFHDVVARLDALEEAAGADPAGRAGGCRDEVRALLAGRPLAHRVAVAMAAGELPVRLVHNDAKAANFLVDDATGRPEGMVDLDTVGPGTVLFDVGDLVRTGAATAPEDSDPEDSAPRGAGTVGVRPEVVAAILEGYREGGAGYLVDAEVRLLPLGGPLMALEAAARFLTDHLAGDVYFRIAGPGHNLVRARNQLRILELLTPGPVPA